MGLNWGLQCLLFGVQGLGFRVQQFFHIGLSMG